MKGLPSWNTAELPQPLPFHWRNALRTIGPGAILLAASIGGGEWLVGPAMGVAHGAGIFWIATTAIILQTIFNLEAIRYTLYTGEPVVCGFMRLAPSAKFWAVIWIALTGIQLGFPALGAACSSTIFSAFAGHLPEAGDQGLLRWITYGVMLVTVAVLASGRTIERMLEIASWFMIAFIFVFLTAANLIFVPFAHWWTTARGFFEFGHLPAGTDLVMLATLAATAGSGGVGNMVITSWVRDKGFGMGSVVGAIPSALGGREIRLSRTGTVFPISAENLRRWKDWWRYVHVDQVWLWAAGCFGGMFLNVNLATAIVPNGTDMAGIAAGAFQAKYMAEKLWAGFWFLALLNGFWILFSTHLGNTDTLVRTVTDVVWASGSGREDKGSSNAARIYYGVLAAFTLWGVVGVNSATAIRMFQILGIAAGPVFVLASIQLLRVNTSLLPPELRPPLWRRAALGICAGFYLVLFVAVVANRLG